MSDPLELKVVLRYLIWVLGIKLWFSAKAARLMTIEPSHQPQKKFFLNKGKRMTSSEDTQISS